LLFYYYNLLYDWDYNEMCRFIENYSEEEFVEHYATYYRLCDDYGKESYIAEVEKAINDFTKKNNLKLNLIENRFAEIIT